MKPSPLVLLLALAGCHSLALPSPRALEDFAVAAVEPKESASFRLYKVLQAIGSESDTFTPIDGGGVEAKASFTFNDRGTDVPLAADFRLDRDGRIRRFDAWGFVARDVQLDDHVLALDGGRFAVRRLAQPSRTVTPAAPFAVASGYAPMLGQELLLRAWIAGGRPARMALLPEGEARIESRGHEDYVLDGRSHSFEHFVIAGLVWGREDAWLDDEGKLAAVVTRDAEYDHFEGVRRAYAPLVGQLVARAGADAVSWLAGAVHRQDDGGGAVALVGGRLIDGSGAPAIEDAVVVYDGDRIVAAGARATTPIPPGARRVDVGGKSILPGLWDMHAHVEQVEQAAVYLAAGVTTVRDEGNIMEFITAVRDAIEAGRGIGPRVIVDGLVDGESRVALGAMQIDSEADIAPMIESLVAAHCAELKIYGSVRASLVPPLVAEAHRRGLRVTGHIPFGMNVEQAIDAGFDGVNHVDMIESMIFPWTLAELRKLSPDESHRRLMALDVKSPMVQRLFDKMVAHHVMFDPTLAFSELGSYPAAELARREPGLAKMPPTLRGNFPGVDAAEAQNSDAEFHKFLEVVTEAHRRGVIIVAGTDQAVLGHSLHRELELYVAAGMTPMEALEAATSLPAKMLGRDGELGTIAAGKRADLIVVDGNPLADIRDTRKVTLVVARGRAYDPAPLWRLAGFQP